jgi:hypothetical protein
MSDGPILNIHMQTPGYGDVCFVCGGEASGFHGVPIVNGDLVSNDWPGPWGGVPACEPCYEKHERGELRTYDAEYRHLLEGFQGEGDGI